MLRRSSQTCWRSTARSLEFISLQGCCVQRHPMDNLLSIASCLDICSPYSCARRTDLQKRWGSCQIVGATSCHFVIASAGKICLCIMYLTKLRTQSVRPNVLPNHSSLHAITLQPVSKFVCYNCDACDIRLENAQCFHSSFDGTCQAKSPAVAHRLEHRHDP